MNLRQSKSGFVHGAVIGAIACIIYAITTINVIIPISIGLFGLLVWMWKSSPGFYYKDNKPGKDLM